jgi:hypothetical protein
MTAETLDTLRRDMTAAAASLADAENGAKSAYESMLTAALPIANAVEEGRPVADSAVTAFRIRRESLAASYDAADLARLKFHAADEKFHAAESQNRATILADERRLQEGR